MSYNYNFNNNFPCNMYPFHGNYAPVFRGNFSIPPPPLPPPIPPPMYISPWVVPKQSDQDFIKSYEQRLQEGEDTKPKIVSISEAREKIAKLVLTLEDIKKMEALLKDNFETLSEEEWNLKMKEIADKRMDIETIFFSMGDSYYGELKKLLAKRISKRWRLKNVKSRRARERDEQRKLLQERSRQIDENLKKIKDDILKTKQQAEEKLEADAVLKDVLRKKSDARKCIIKLDGIMDLRKARMKTAKGRGDTVNEKEMTIFKNNIDKIKSLWNQKLAIYDKEESDLRQTLKKSNEPNLSNETEDEVLENLKAWRQLLFGECLPQFNFKGDVEKFINIRSQWDRYVSSEGTALPMGWVIPKLDG